LQGAFTQLDGYVDKRPYFFPFLVSLLHDFLGYRSSNGFLLNALLTPLFLGLLFICGRSLWPSIGGYVACLLFATVPLLAMNVNGGGFELLNLVMILATLIAAKSYLGSPDSSRMDIVILLGLLLAQTRYESVLYVIAVGIVILLGWLRRRRLIISPVLVLAPLFMVPFGLQQLIFDDYPGLWQLKDGAVQPFSLQFISGNLRHASDYFFNVMDDQQPNSLLLSVVFVVLLVPAVLNVRKWTRETESHLLFSYMAFGGVMVFNFALLMSYHWGQINEIVATRIVLPFLLFQVLFVVFILGTILKSRPSRKWINVALLLYFVSVTLPLTGRSDFLKNIPDQHTAVWLKDILKSYRNESVLIVTNQPLIALAEQIPAIAQGRAKRNKAKLNFHHQVGTFSEILFMYSLVADPDELGGFKPITPILKDFELETLLETPFGRERLIRLARLKSVIWLDEDEQTIDLSDYNHLQDGPEKLAFLAQTLP